MIVQQLHKYYPQESITPKLHFLAIEIPRFVRQFRTVGILSEQNIESFHAQVNTLERQYSGMPNSIRRYEEIKGWKKVPVQSTRTADSCFFASQLAHTRTTIRHTTHTRARDTRMDLLAAAADADAAARAESPSVRGQRTTTEQRWSVVAMHKDNRSNCHIARKLGISRTTVRDILARYDTTGSPLSGTRKGRPRCTDEALDTAIAFTARVDVFTSLDRSNASSISTAVVHAPSTIASRKRASSVVSHDTSPTTPRLIAQHEFALQHIIDIWTGRKYSSAMRNASTARDSAVKHGCDVSPARHCSLSTACPRRRILPKSMCGAASHRRVWDTHISSTRTWMLR